MSKGERVAYCRVSSTEQNLDRQVEAVGKVDKMFTEKRSGRNIHDRPDLEACMDYLREGDTLVIPSIDRAARSLSDLNRIITYLIEKQVTVTFLKENLTFSPGKQDAMGTLLFHILGSFAEFERSLIKERQAEGIKAALARGVVFGRKSKFSHEQCLEIARRVEEGAKVAHLAKEYSCARGSIYAAIKRATLA